MVWDRGYPSEVGETSKVSPGGRGRESMKKRRKLEMELWMTRRAINMCTCHLSLDVSMVPEVSNIKDMYSRYISNYLKYQ